MTRRFPWGLTVATLLLCAVLLGLGFWQMQRLAWKQALLAEHARQLQQPPVTLMLTPVPSAPVRTLYAMGPDKTPGWRHLRLMQRQGSQGLLWVDWGWKRTATTVFPPSRPQQVTGRFQAALTGKPWLRPANESTRWYWLDAAALRATGAPSPILVADPPLLAGAQAVAVYAQLRNNHLGYAVTWFGLAAALLAVYGGMLRRWQRMQGR